MHRRNGGYLFGYGHVPLFIGAADAGAGLPVAGLQLEHHWRISDLAVVLSLVVPVGLNLLMVYLLHTLLLSAADCFHLLLIALTLAPVVGYETIGHQHQQHMLKTFVKRTTEARTPLSNRQLGQLSDGGSSPANLEPGWPSGPSANQEQGVQPLLRRGISLGSNGCHECGLGDTRGPVSPAPQGWSQRGLGR